MKWRGVMCAMALSLAACSGDGHSEPQSADVEVPDAVRDMMATDFPADGKIHAQNRGTFNVQPTTYFCTFDPGFGVNGLQAALEEIGQSGYLDGGPRTNGIFGERVSRQCAPGASGNPIFIRGFDLPNREGEPYKLVLAVWQGNPTRGGAVWVGGIERGSGRYHPNAFAVADDMGSDSGERIWHSSARLDVEALSREFRSNVQLQGSRQ